MTPARREPLRHGESRPSVALRKLVSIPSAGPRLAQTDRAPSRVGVAWAASRNLPFPSCPLRGSAAVLERCREPLRPPTGGRGALGASDGSPRARSVAGRRSCHRQDLQGNRVSYADRQKTGIGDYVRGLSLSGGGFCARGNAVGRRTRKEIEKSRPVGLGTLRRVQGGTRLRVVTVFSPVVPGQLALFPHPGKEGRRSRKW